MSSKDQLKHLLNYTTSLSENAPAQQATDAAPYEPSARKLDSSMLEAIMGPDDAKLMLESMTAIEDASLSDEEHEIAFENLEALVEQIDNAKNLKNLKLWQPLLKQLAKPEPLFRRGGCSVMATAVQNNPDSQADFLAIDGLAAVLKRFEQDTDLGVRRKALFAVTATLRNNPAGRERFGELSGWSAFSTFLDDAGNDANMQKRIIFFLSTLYGKSDSSEGEATSKEIRTGFPPKLVSLLGHEHVQADEDLAEKILLTLFAALEDDPAVLNHDLKTRLRGLARTMRTRYGEDMCPFDELDRHLAA